MESKNADEMIASVMAMGFELEDCQQAIENGITTAQAAIEWILSGKPKQQSVLKLRSEAIQDSGAVQTVLATDPLLMETEEGLTSRYYKNEEQRKFKERFESKLREEAKVKAREEKEQQRKERARVLQQIQEDRDKLKEKIQQPAKLADNQSTQQAVPVSPPDKCLLQIRFPSGETIRHSFDSTAKLVDVWDFVYNMKGAEIRNCLFMQPFPRHEFHREEWGKTLQDLRLTPTGSLVLQKHEVDQAMAAPGEDWIAEDGAKNDGEASDDNEDGSQNAAIGAENFAQNRPAFLPGLLHDDRGMRGRMPGVLVNPILPGNFPPGGPQGAPFPQDDPGYRLLPDNYGFGSAAHHSQPATQLAAQAAEERSRSEATTSRSSHSLCNVLYQPGALVTLTMNHLARRLSEHSQHLIHSLSGLTPNVANKFIAHLIREGQLRPHSLKAFSSCFLSCLNLDCYAYTTNELLSSVRHFTNLSNLSLHSCTLITDQGLRHLTGLKRLKVLNLGGCRQITDQSVSVLVMLPNLHTLNLEDTAITDFGIESYVQAGVQKLQHLNLARTAVTQSSIVSLKGVPGLKTLSLEETKVSSLTGIQELIELESLNVAHTNIVTDSLLCLQHHPALICLNIAGTDYVQGNQALSYITGLKLQQLFLPSRHTTDDQGLSYLPSMALTALDLTNYINVTDAGMVHVGNLTSLRKLLLCNTKITDEGMLHLKDLILLEALFLDRTLVSDAGVSVIKEFTKLEELSLSSTGITSRLLMGKTFEKLVNLTKLNLSRTNISDKGACSLKLANLTMLNLDCTRVHPRVQDTILVNCPQLRKITLANLTPVAEVEEMQEEEEEEEYMDI